MTVSELHTRFKIKFDKIDSFNSPELSPEQIDEMLNIAQEELINMIGRKGFEKDQDYMDYVNNITIPYSTTNFTTTSLNKPNGVFIDLPSDYRTCLLEYVDITYTDCNNTTQTKTVEVKPISRDRYNTIVRDPFNKPGKHTVQNKVVRLSSSVKQRGVNDTFELIPGSDLTITKYYIDYIRQPQKIKYGTAYATPSTDVNCELSIKAQEKIVDLAVDEALKILGLTERYTINKQEETQENK